MLPSVMLATARIARSAAQRSPIGRKLIENTRATTTKPAAFEPVDRKAVTGVGAPS